LSDQDYTVPNIPDSLAQIAKRWEIKEFGPITFGGGAPVLLCLEDAERWSLTLVWPAGGFFVLSNPPAGSTSWGLPATNQPIYLNYRDHGYLACSQWYIWSSGAVVNKGSAIGVSWRNR